MSVHKVEYLINEDNYFYEIGELIGVDDGSSMVYIGRLVRLGEFNFTIETKFGEFSFRYDSVLSVWEV